MSESRRISRRARRLALIALLSIGALPALPGDVLAEGCSEPPPAAVGAVRVYVDPVTGELLDHPPPGEPPQALPETPASEPDIPVTVRPDGTVLADVGDRFRSELRAEIVDGQLVTCHGPVQDEAAGRSADLPNGIPDRDPDR